MSHDAQTIVHIENMTKRFGNVAAVDGLDLKIRAGEFVTFLGPSGCGKTTTLRVLGGFEIPTEGRIILDGADVTRLPPNRRNVNMVFQDYALFPHMKLIDNVGFGLRMRGIGKAERDEKALSYLDLVGLKGSAGKKPHELSGGQRQRVALARALAVDPDVLLLDEPLGALDLKLRRQMQDELKALQNGRLAGSLALRDGDTIVVPRAESVYVFGQVRTPGAYPLTQKDTTVLQALSLAGGETDRGATGRIKIVRMVKGKRVEIKAKLGDIVLPLDTIMVPERFF